MLQKPVYSTSTALKCARNRIIALILDLNVPETGLMSQKPDYSTNTGLKCARNRLNVPEAGL